MEVCPLRETQCMRLDYVAQILTLLSVFVLQGLFLLRLVLRNCGVLLCHRHLARCGKEASCYRGETVPSILFKERESEAFSNENRVSKKLDVNIGDEKP